jgi:large subunit ribosomal protein L31
MKADIHPKYNLSAKPTCVCGAEFSIGYAKEELGVEICSQCHPFFTGQEKVMDTARRVEKFKSRQSKSTAKK